MAQAGKSNVADDDIDFDDDVSDSEMDKMKSSQMSETRDEDSDSESEPLSDIPQGNPDLQSSGTTGLLGRADPIKRPSRVATAPIDSNPAQPIPIGLRNQAHSKSAPEKP